MCAPVPPGAARRGCPAPLPRVTFGCVWQSELGAIAPETLVSLSNLGNLHFAKGDYARAAALLEQAMLGLDRQQAALPTETSTGMVKVVAVPPQQHGLVHTATARRR